jgi:hypothetical protein
MEIILLIFIIYENIMMGKFILLYIINANSFFGRSFWNNIILITLRYLYQLLLKQCEFFNLLKIAFFCIFNEQYGCSLLLSCRSMVWIFNMGLAMRFLGIFILVIFGNHQILLVFWSLLEILTNLLDSLYIDGWLIIILPFLQK